MSADRPPRLALAAALVFAACFMDSPAEGEAASEGEASGGTATSAATSESSGPATSAETTSSGTTGAPETTTSSSTGSGSTTSTSTSTSSSTSTEPTTGEATTTGEPNQCTTKLEAIVRDFKVAHPDFESAIGVDLGIVATTLGADMKPVYSGDPSTPTTTGAANFNQWFNDVPGVNISLPVSIVVEDDGEGGYVFDSDAFFPIDGLGWGDEGNPHNYHFTLELHTQFKYEGGEVFGFTGDDDLFVFVNGALAIDLGGVHGPLSGDVDMDAQAAQLGLTPGNTYALDFFFAERHTTQSNFRIETTIGCIELIPG